VPCMATDPNPRGSALAHAVVAATETGGSGRTAFELLRVAEAADPRDSAVAAHLAQFYHMRADERKALPLFERVVAADSSQPGNAIAQANRLDDAARVWQLALRVSPALTAARLNPAHRASPYGKEAG
jgi:hypothetical protein